MRPRGSLPWLVLGVGWCFAFQLGRMRNCPPASQIIVRTRNTSATSQLPNLFWAAESPRCISALQKEYKFEARSLFWKVFRKS